jgi:hypothetical protein
MNAIEIEEAISELAEQPFDADEFPFEFLMRLATKKPRLKNSEKVPATNQIWVVFCRPATSI